MGSRGGGFVRCAHCQGQAHPGPHRPPGPIQATWRISDNLKTGWPAVMHRLLTVVLLATSLPCCLGYCRSLGWNPSFNGPPLVEQLTLTSVRVSWAGKLEQAECADNIIVKHYKGINSNDYHLSEPLPTEVTSYVVLDLTPNIEYTYQVCIGLLYNCLRRRAPVKDLELSNSKYDGEGDDEEESEEDDEEEDGIDVDEFEDNGRDTKKFDMMEQMTQKLERPKLLRPISVA